MILQNEKEERILRLFYDEEEIKKMELEKIYNDYQEDFDKEQEKVFMELFSKMGLFE